MSIREINDNTILQTCDVCGRVRSSDIDDLTVGMVIENQINAAVIPLPKCNQCGAVEYLIPSNEDAADHPSPGSFGHRHAILVDVLHERLVQRGRVVSGIEADALKKRKRSQEEIDRWFKDGLNLKPLSDAASTAEGIGKKADEDLLSK